MSYFISQGEDTGWRFDAERLLAALRADWAGADVRPTTLAADPYAHEFAVTTAAGTLHGKVHRARTSVALDGSPAAVAEFAVWVQRQVVGEERALLVYDEQFARVAPLGGTSTREQIAQELT